MKLSLRRRIAQAGIAKTLACAAISYLCICGVARGNEPGLKVMSFNIRYSYGKPQEPAAENDWYDAKYPRRERAIRVIRDYLPDVLGVQEARDLQIEDLRTALPEYEFYGIGRDDGKTEGEFSGIYFLANRFTKKDAGSFWLSDDAGEARHHVLQGRECRAADCFLGAAGGERIRPRNFRAQHALGSHRCAGPKAIGSTRARAASQIGGGSAHDRDGRPQLRRAIGRVSRTVRRQRRNWSQAGR